MNEKRSHGGHPWLILLIPATVILAKAMHRRRAMWDPEWPAGGGWHGHRSGGWSEGRTAASGEVRLPPRIESILDAWHERAHQPANPAPAAE